MFNKKYETRYGDYKDFETIKPFHEIISLLRNREMGLE